MRGLIVVALICAVLLLAVFLLVGTCEKVRKTEIGQEISVGGETHTVIGRSGLNYEVWDLGNGNGDVGLVPAFFAIFVGE